MCLTHLHVNRNWSTLLYSFGFTYLFTRDINPMDCTFLTGEKGDECNYCLWTLVFYWNKAMLCLEL